MPHPCWACERWANVDRRFRYRARLRFQPRRWTGSQSTSVWRWTATEETGDCAAAGAGGHTGRWKCFGEFATAAVPLCAAAALEHLLRRIIEFRPVICVLTAERVHMSAQVTGCIWCQLLRRTLRLYRIWQQSAGQEMEGHGQERRVVLRPHARRTVQPRAVRTKQEDARCARVVLHRRGGHDTSEEHAHAKLRFVGKAWAAPTILDRRLCQSWVFRFCSNYWPAETRSEDIMCLRMAQRRPFHQCTLQSAACNSPLERYA